MFAAGFGHVEAPARDPDVFPSVIPPGHDYTVSQKSSPFLFLSLLGQMLTDFNNIYEYCS